MEGNILLDHSLLCAQNQGPQEKAAQRQVPDLATRRGEGERGGLGI